MTNIVCVRNLEVGRELRPSFASNDEQSHLETLKFVKKEESISPVTAAVVKLDAAFVTIY